MNLGSASQIQAADGEEEMTHYYAWGPRLMGFDRKGHSCRILARGAMNSALIKFEDGFTAIVSRNALRRLKDGR